MMYELKPLPAFAQWLQSLRDAQIRAVISARLQRLARGLPGDVRPVGMGVSELRIHLGAGWRVYFTRHGQRVIVLLAGGSKRTQKQDIERAQALAAQLSSPPKTALRQETLP